MQFKKLKHAMSMRHKHTWVLVGLTLVAYFAATNRYHALPWVIAAILLAALVVAFIMPYFLIRKLSISRVGPNSGEEGKAITLTVAVKNDGWLPRFMVEAIDYLPFMTGSTDFKKMEEQLLGVVAYVGGGNTKSFDVDIVCEKRGRYALGPVRLGTSFPLGLVEFRRQKDESQHWLTVYPHIFPLIAFPFAGSLSEIHRGEYLLPMGAGSSEFTTLREYQRGDNPRHLHWPSTVRHQKLMIKEFEPLASAVLYFGIDLSAVSNVGEGKHTTFEYSMSIAASIARYACDHGISQRVEGEADGLLSIESGVGEAHFQACLDIYATLDAEGSVPYAKVLQTIAMSCRAGDTVVVFIAEPAIYYEGTMQALSMIRERGAHIVAIVFDRHSFNASEPKSTDNWNSLLEMGATCITIKNGDDLMRRFNI